MALGGGQDRCSLRIVTRKLDAEIAFPAQCELAEGPVWDAARGLLRWVDILPGDVHALDPASGEHSSFGTGQMVGTVGLTRDGGLVLALAGGFALSGSDGQDLRPFGDFSVDRSVTRFNDGKPDPWGSFWAGTMAVPEDSGYPCSLYRLSPDGAVTELFGGVGLSNGLDWSDDRRVFYYSDSHAGVDLFGTDPDTGTLGTRRRFTEVSGGVPDGLTLDAEGGLWLAVWGSGELRRYLPDGRVDVVVSLPVTQVTSAAFGGADLGTLYITTARENFTPADLAAQPHAGDIFACTPGVTGRPPYLFGG
jgi:sugar lactone lactonase YvrE